MFFFTDIAAKIRKRPAAEEGLGKSFNLRRVEQGRLSFIQAIAKNVSPKNDFYKTPGHLQKIKL
jgi:hypothetical protein